MILHKTKNPYPLIPSSFVVSCAFPQGYREQPCLNPLSSILLMNSAIWKTLERPFRRIQCTKFSISFVFSSLSNDNCARYNDFLSPWTHYLALNAKSSNNFRVENLFNNNNVPVQHNFATVKFKNTIVHHIKCIIPSCQIYSMDNVSQLSSVRKKQKFHLVASTISWQ